jgi:hypothetical protein
MSTPEGADAKLPRYPGLAGLGSRRELRAYFSGHFQLPSGPLPVTLGFNVAHHHDQWIQPASLAMRTASTCVRALSLVVMDVR